MNGGDSFAVIVFVFVGIVLYLLPALLAEHRKCKAAAGIVIVNLFLGWTFIGWIVALAWAACGEKKLAADPARPLTPDEEKQAMALLARMAANRPPAA